MRQIAAAVSILLFLTCIALYIWGSYHREPNPPYDKTHKGEKISKAMLYCFWAYCALTFTVRIYGLITE